MASYTHNLIPKMISNTSEGLCRASSEYDDKYTAWKAFDKTNADIYCWYTHDEPTGWIYYKFTKPKII